MKSYINAVISNLRYEVEKSHRNKQISPIVEMTEQVSFSK
jgi:hypothetical protein